MMATWICGRHPDHSGVYVLPIHPAGSNGFHPNECGNWIAISRARNGLVLTAKQKRHMSDFLTANQGIVPEVELQALRAYASFAEDLSVSHYSLTMNWYLVSSLFSSDLRKSPPKWAAIGDTPDTAVAHLYASKCIVLNDADPDLGSLSPKSVAIAESRYVRVIESGSTDDLLPSTWTAFLEPEKRESISDFPYLDEDQLFVEDGFIRRDDLIEQFANGSKADIMHFWRNPPDWLSTAATPNQALKSLLGK